MHITSEWTALPRQCCRADGVSSHFPHKCITQDKNVSVHQRVIIKGLSQPKNDPSPCRKIWTESLWCKYRPNFSKLKPI